MKKQITSLALLLALAGACGPGPQGVDGGLDGGARPSPDLATPSIVGAWRTADRAQRFVFEDSGAFTYAGPEDRSRGTYTLKEQALVLELSVAQQPQRIESTLHLSARTLCVGAMLRGEAPDDRAPDAQGTYTSRVREETTDPAGQLVVRRTRSTLALQAGGMALLSQDDGAPTGGHYTYDASRGEVTVRMEDRQPFTLQVLDGAALCSTPFNRSDS